MPLWLQTMALMGSMASCAGNKMACMDQPQLPGQLPGSPVAAEGVKAEPGSAEDSLEQRIAGMSLTGYSYCARNDVSLDQMLDKIKDNLRLEQRIICELNATIIHRVFTPIQVRPACALCNPTPPLMLYGLLLRHSRVAAPWQALPSQL